MLFRSQPLSQPAVEPSRLKAGADFAYKARFEVKPEIEKVEWQGLELSKPATASIMIATVSLMRTTSV